MRTAVGSLAFNNSENNLYALIPSRRQAPFKTPNRALRSDNRAEIEGRIGEDSSLLSRYRDAHFEQNIRDAGSPSSAVGGCFRTNAADFQLAFSDYFYATVTRHAGQVG